MSAPKLSTLLYAAALAGAAATGRAEQQPAAVGAETHNARRDKNKAKAHAKRERRRAKRKDRA